MSYSNRNDYIKNPASMFIEWNGAEGYFYFYHKEDKQRYNIDELRFVVLDQLNSIKGFNETTDAGIYANEVRNLGKDNLIVKTTKGLHIASGLYSSIKDNIKANGGKFSKIVYALLFNEKQNSFELVSLSFTGAAFSAWVDILKEAASLYDTVFVWKGGFSDHKKGTITYKKPIFVIDDISEISPEIKKNAQKFDEVLQEYITSKNGSVIVPPETENNIESQETKSDDAIKAFEADIPVEMQDGYEKIHE